MTREENALQSAPAPTDAGQASQPSLALLRGILLTQHPGRAAVVSSFGVESAVLLHLVAAVSPATPVILLDTGHLFPETLAHRDALAARLGLLDVRTTRPDRAALGAGDPDGTLWRDAPEQCCWHRKVEPLDDALQGFDAWITGRKRFQGGERGDLPMLEREPGGRVKVNPLAGWQPADIAGYQALHALPAHPLQSRGYRSVGCAPCTRATLPGEASRAGRWAGQARTECGIHLSRPAAMAGARS